MRLYVSHCMKPAEQTAFLLLSLSTVSAAVRPAICKEPGCKSDPVHAAGWQASDCPRLYRLIVSAYAVACLSCC